MPSRLHGWCAFGRTTPSIARPRALQRGQATVEFALVLPFVFVLLLLIVQLGFVMRDYVRVAHAAREAARAASVDPSDDRAHDVVEHLLGDAIVTVDRSGGVGDPVTAWVTFTSHTEVPIIGALLPDVTIDDSITIRAEQE